MNWKDKPNLNRAQDILDFLKKHRGWYLEQCPGIRSPSWFWVRNRKNTSQVIRCNFNAGYAAYRKLNP